MEDEITNGSILINKGTVNNKILQLIGETNLINLLFCI